MRTFFRRACITTLVATGAGLVGFFIASASGASDAVLAIEREPWPGGVLRHSPDRRRRHNVVDDFDDFDDPDDRIHRDDRHESG